ncbi:MAG: hydroxyacid-oxoacid transhydrogenase [Caldilineaceae bacterium]
MSHETAFTMDTSSIKFGPGVTREVGQDMAALGARRVMVVTDPNLAGSEPVATVTDALRAAGLDVVVYDRVRVEPTDASFKDAIDFATAGDFDGFVAVGGGSTIDTAKVANLFSTWPNDLLAYVNAPIGRAEPVPGPLKPLIGVPTTAGTASEITGVAIFDFLEMHAKTGIAHRALRPVMGIVDPLNTVSMTPMQSACTGLDVLCHALESMTALPYDQRPAPPSPKLRPTYQGANPISHIWATESIKLVAENLPIVVAEPDNVDARGKMMLAAVYGGMGFGNAGVHLCHGMSYPVSGMVRDYKPAGYISDHPIIPHGMSVALNAPAVFRFTASTNPDLHLLGAQLMGAETRGAAPEDAGDILAGAIVKLMQQVGMPNGLAAVGFTPDDIEELVEKTLPQHRVTKLSPHPAGGADLNRMFAESMQIW